LKVLLYDIETSPNLGYTWGKYEQNVVAFKKEWTLLSFAFKWLDEKGVTCHSIRTAKTERALVKKLHKLMGQADIVIAHNGNQFDNKKAHAKFIEYGLPPPAPYAQVDTCQVARRYFQFTSNKLDDLGALLKVGRKLKTGGFDLWLGCMAGDKKSWLKMESYNKKDVELLERVYLKLRPWIKNHPDVADRPDGCPKCGGVRLKSHGIRRMATRSYRRFYCKDCGGWSRGTTTFEKIERKVVS
jgi:hypothetical protein